MGERDYLRMSFGRPPRAPFWSTYPATKALLIGLVAIHLVMAFLYSLAPDAWRAVREFLLLHPEHALKRFFVWQLVTCALFHAQGTIWHLVFNGLMIFFFGRIVEQRLGWRRYVYFCLGATAASSLAFLVESALLDQVHPMLGASGLAMGLTVLAACWYPHTTVLLFFVLPMPLWVLAALLVFMDLIMLLQMPGSIAHSAHLGGALYGLIYFRYGGGVERIFGAIDRMADKQRLRKQQRRHQRESELRREVDRILDKVNREGMAALSKEERRFLKEASEKLRR
ncbi:MAG: rhomboid family intramembrane serine protease [Planctomycetota bacterium]|jgi:membrane associated rhomboid family serine protease